MRLPTLTIVLLLSSFCFSQRWVPVSQTAPKFQIYYAKFRSAAQKRDKAAVASLTAFPFERNYGQDAESFARTEFIARYDEVFEKAKVFAESDPTLFEFKSGYIVAFDQNGSGENYLFKPVAGNYMFYSIKPEVYIKLESTAADFQAFYAKLRSAVSDRNNVAIASLTQFPFKRTTSTFDSASDTTKSDTVELSKAEFLKKIRIPISDLPKTPEFILHHDRRFSILCENFSDDDSCAIPHYFEKVGNTYKLTEMVIDARN